MLTLFFESPTSDLISFYINDGGESDQLDITRLEQLPLKQLPEKLQSLPKQKITLVIPGEQVTSKIILAPKGSKRNINQAIPFLLEDDVATPVEDLHFAMGKPNSDGQILCAVIEKNLLAAYLQTLADLDIHPSALTPDYWLLPKSNTIESTEFNHRRLIRLTDDTGMALPENTPESLLRKVCNRIDITTETSVSVNTTFSSKEGILQANQAPLNLLQGEFALESSQENPSWFKSTTIAIGICGLIFIVYFISMGWYFNQQVENLAEEAKTSYQQLFPNDTRILNIRHQMTAHMNNSDEDQKDGLFFELTNAVSQAIAAEASSSKTGEEVTIRHIRYDQNDSTLQLELQAKSMSYAHSLQSQIQVIGFAAEVLSANSNDEGVIARLKLSEKRQ